jgi:pimeloyl-ACP methyl ester carboxylesterase
MVGDVETSYQRGGRGDAVLVLLPPREAAQLTPLATTLRVVIPDSISILALPALGESETFSRWLRGFLDGLGLFGVTIVASTALKAELTRFSASHPDHVRRLVFVGAAPVDWAALLAELT